MLIRITFLIILTLFAMNFSASSQTVVPIENGVSQVLARWRAANYSDVRYKLNITLEKGAPLMKGELEVTLKLSGEGAKNDLVLDWRTTQFANDKDKPSAHVIQVNNAIDIISWVVNEHLIVPKGLLKTGENIIKIQFSSPIKTSGAAITRYVDKEDGGEYIYSLFVPSDASTAFPCFDQPDLKARFRLSVIAPVKWKVVSNTAENWPATPSDPEKARQFAMESDRRKAQLEQDAKANFEFEETKPISTYVFAFAAGNFDTFFENTYNTSNVITSPIDAPTDGNRIYVRRSQAEKFKQHAAEVFRLNREGVKFLGDYFGYLYPFPKYDLVLIPEFPFGGMEHAGATFLREDSIIFPQEPTANNYISRANVIFHEAAHQWFGDTVTMRWFDDLWLKEGFAEFMAYKTLEKVMPQYNAWKVFYERNKQAAYLTDSTKGTTPIYQEISNLSAAKSAYGNIVYRKAPSFLRQAEFYLGEVKFQTAVRAFLKKHEYANAGWEDLMNEFKSLSKDKDLDLWADNWLKKPGVPVVRAVGYSGNPNSLQPTPLHSQYIYSIYQKSLLQEKVFKQKINVLSLDSNGVRNTVAVETCNSPTEKDIAKYYPCNFGFEKFNIVPQAIFLNVEDKGYGIFLMDDKSRDYVLQNIQDEKDDFLRAMMWGSLWDSVREGELDPKDYVELVIKNLGTEKDEVTIAGLLGRVSTAMNYYLSEKQRAELAPQLEGLLIDKILTTPVATQGGRKLTYYRSFLGIASTEKARDVLKDIFKGRFTKRGPQAINNTDILTDDRPAPGDDKLPDTHVVTDQIPLKTKDKFDIVTRLLILGDKDAPALLAELEKTENSDEAKRYSYAAKAGIAAAENKAKYFDDFVNNKTISESWIEAAFGAFNSVRHSELTLPYLEKALAELPNLKRNRKIFFVNGWLGAFIGGQRGAKALAVVDKFLADNPNLDKDLRLKILENADGLERAVKIRAKFSGN